MRLFTLCVYCMHDGWAVKYTWDSLLRWLRRKWHRGMERYRVSKWSSKFSDIDIITSDIQLKHYIKVILIITFPIWKWRYPTTIIWVITSFWFWRLSGNKSYMHVRVYRFNYKTTTSEILRGQSEKCLQPPPKNGGRTKMSIFKYFFYHSNIFKESFRSAYSLFIYKSFEFEL